MSRIAEPLRQNSLIDWSKYFPATQMQSWTGLTIFLAIQIASELLEK